jgi:hypothetical protein
MRMGLLLQKWYGQYTTKTIFQIEPILQKNAQSNKLDWYLFAIIGS